MTINLRLWKLIAFSARFKLMNSTKKPNAVFLTIVPEVIMQKKEVQTQNEKNKRQPTLVSSSSPSFIPEIFFLLNDLMDLGSLIGKFFGPIWLASFTSIFIVTTIQIFYCYTNLYASSEAQAKTIWTLIGSINSVFVNIVLVFTLISFCEAIASQVFYSVL